MEHKKAPIDSVCGTSLQGYIYATYADLVAAFGEPHTNGDGYKVDAEWILQFADGTIATIYNYKDGKNYMGDDGEAVESITDWHVGGTSDRARHRVADALAEALA